MVFDKFLQIFKIRELRNKILFVLALLIVFRLTANIPVPGVDLLRLKDFFASNQFFGLLNMFTGGALNNMSIIMLGVGPYITATIIMQLLTMIFPSLEAMYKEEGESGRQKFNQISRILTVPLGILQGFAMLSLLRSQHILAQSGGFHLATTIAVVTAGTVFLMWLGELISEKGIGNGVSLLIFAGIVAGFPTSFSQTIAAWDNSKLPVYILFIAIALFIVAGVVYITEARRNIPVSYAKRVRGNRMYGGVSTYLPLSVNPAGVIPIIFALSIMLFPGMLGNFFANSEIHLVAVVANYFKNTFQDSGWLYNIAYFLLVVIFTYFYTAVTFDPKNVADNLQKSGGFVPGIRPGKSTVDFLSYILNRVLLTGAVFLGLIAVAPSLVQSITSINTFSVGGTSILIAVSVVLETIRQIESQLVMRDYEKF